MQRFYFIVRGKTYLPARSLFICKTHAKYQIKSKGCSNKLQIAQNPRKPLLSTNAPPPSCSKCFQFLEGATHSVVAGVGPKDVEKRKSAAAARHSATLKTACSSLSLCNSVLGNVRANPRPKASQVTSRGRRRR